MIRQVCNALTLSTAMKSRATQLHTKGFLQVFLASKEDIFLFKGITEREADLDDMRLLAESGLNWNIMYQECQNQSTSTGRLWENALYQKLIDLKEKHHIESPIEKSQKKSRGKTDQNHLNRRNQKGKQHRQNHITSHQGTRTFRKRITQQTGKKNTDKNR